MCKIASQLLHEYKKLNLVVYGKILYMVKIKVDFSYTIKKTGIRKNLISVFFIYLIISITSSGKYFDTSFPFSNNSVTILELIFPKLPARI